MQFYSGGLSVPVPDPQVLELRRRAATAFPANNDAGAAPLNQNNDKAPSHKWRSSVDAERIRAMANWDPSYPLETVDWYGEYIARHGPISMSWLQQPMGPTDTVEESREIGGLGYIHNGNKVVAPLDDGSVCLWDIGYEDTTGTRRGAILGRSKPGLLSVNPAYNPHGSGQASGMANKWSDVVECVSVDNTRKKAYFAVRSGLNEVDLETLQISSHEHYPFLISALSVATYPVPLTIGTTMSLHLHDPRQANNARSSDSGTHRVENVADFPVSQRARNDFLRVISGSPISAYAPLFQPGPLSILHVSPDNINDASAGQIYVGGRFPSVLIYDRRSFPTLRNTIHSGARLSSLTSLPYNFQALESGLMGQNQLSLEAVHASRSQPGTTLVACGEYNGKGSLEIYGLSSNCSPIRDQSQAGGSQPSTYKNRVSASRSKLLSISTHGTRLVFSDSDGQIKWVERNGSTLVRRWNINQYQQPKEERGLFSLSTHGANTGDVARKILPTARNEDGGHIERDELLVWTGERIGLISFKNKSAFGVEDWEENIESEEERTKRREERIYGQTMRRALQTQADEVRFVRGLGLGSRF
ncbi:hypothetical protein MMC06_000971 [Schaereria dolodes]|nr:hypothetical protein [Schaereria dolodes]